MSNDSKRVSQLTVTTTLAQDDRVVVLSNPNGLADAKTITAHNFANSLVNNIIPTANSTQLGVIKVGAGLAVTDSGVLSAPLPIGTKSVTGVVKVGDNINVNQNGLISIPIANSTQLGVIKVGIDGGLSVNSSGSISVSNATSQKAGIVKIGSGIQVDGSGVISVSSVVPPTATNLIGTILTTNSTGMPAWSRFTGVYEVINVNQTGRTSYTVTEKESVVLVNPATVVDDVTIILPIATAIEGKEILVKLIDASTNHKVIITTDDPGNAYLEDPITGSFVNSYELLQTGQAETWIHDGSVYRHLATARATPTFYTDANTYSQVVVKNASAGNNSSSDIALYNNLGDITAGTGPFIDIGIDGSNYSNAFYTLFSNNDAYVYTDSNGEHGGNLLIGTARDTSIVLFANGTLVDNKVMVVNSTMFAVNTAITSLNLHDVEGGAFNVEFNQYGGISNRYWSFDRDNLRLPNQGTITDSFPIFRGTVGESYDQLSWSGTTLTFNNASSSELRDVLALLQPGDELTLDGYSQAVSAPYTGGLNGSIQLNGSFYDNDIVVLLAPDRRNLKDGIRLKTNNHTWTFGNDSNLTLPNSGRITFNEMPSQYIEGNMGFRIHSSDGIQTSVHQENSDPYTQVNQDIAVWEVYPDNGREGDNEAYSWLRVDLPFNDSPKVFIENKKSGTDVKYRWTFDADGALNLPKTGVISETSNTLILTPPGAISAGQSLVIRPTTAPSLTSDHSSGFAPGDTIIITYTPNIGSSGTYTANFTFTGCTEVQLGRQLTGSLVYSAEETKTLSWTIPSISDITTFTFTIDNVAFSGNPDPFITLTSTGSVSNEHSHLHLVSGNTVTTDLYLGDDDQYVKIEKNAGNVVIGTSKNTKQWTFDNDGILTLPTNGFVFGNIKLPNNNNIYDELLRPLLNPNALDINADGGTSTSVFAIRDEAFTGGGSTTVFGRYEAALDGGVSFNNRHSASYIDGGGANVL